MLTIIAPHVWHGTGTADPHPLAQDGMGADDAQPMGAEERGELLGHLKNKWAAVNKAYLKIGFCLDIEVRTSHSRN